MATAVQNNWKVLFGWDLPSIKYAVNTVKMFIDSENGINCLDKIPAKDFLFSKDIPFSTYRLILCNLTNDFDTAQKYLENITVWYRIDRIAMPRQNICIILLLYFSIVLMIK